MATWDWTGTLGWKYEYQIYPVGTELDNVEGNYIYAHHNGRNWEPLYIGAGNLRAETLDHPQAACIKRKGGSHIHAHPNEDEQDREREAADLLRYHAGAYAPSGCNE